MIKLLYITNGINGSGGLERVLSVKTSYLVEEYEYDVAIVTLNETHPNSFYKFSPKVKLHSIKTSSNPLKYIYSYVKGIKKEVKDFQPDIILVCDDGLKGFFIPALLQIKTPIVYERHVSKEIEMHHDFSKLKKYVVKSKWFLMDKLAKQFSKFIVLTEGNKKEWNSLSNVEVISNPVSFYPEIASKLENKKVIAVGKQSYQKGYDLLLAAWKLVIDVHPNWSLEIYGKKDEKKGLEKQARNLHIDKSIKFFDPEKNIEQKYFESAIYVMSSRYEGFGMVLIEAMAYGLPCVSFDCNYGPSDIIADGIDGYVVEKLDYRDLASKIIILIENEDQRKLMASKARQNVKRFLPENIITQWDQLFKGLVSENKV